MWPIHRNTACIPALTHTHTHTPPHPGLRGGLQATETALGQALDAGLRRLDAKQEDARAAAVRAEADRRKAAVKERQEASAAMGLQLNQVWGRAVLCWGV